MDDTPRVTVPVEQLENWRNDLSLHGVGDIQTAVEIDAMLSAAPAPEGGAVHYGDPCIKCGVGHDNVPPGPCRGDGITISRERATAILDYLKKGSGPAGWPTTLWCEVQAFIKNIEAALATSEAPPAEMFGVTGAADETEALAVALFAVHCPGVRMTDEDLHHYRSAAQRAMQVVSAELSGNPGQLEAPTEAGEGVLSPCAPCGGPGKLIHPMGEYVGKGLGEDGGYYGPRGSRVTCQSPASVCCDCTPSFHGPNQDAEAVASWNRRAQPQAREEAQPVAWRAVWSDGTPYGEPRSWPPLDGASVYHGLMSRTIQPLFTTPPAPEAEKLRVAVEAFMPTNIDLSNAGIRDDLVLPIDVTVGELRAISKALAALQQEGR